MPRALALALASLLLLGVGIDLALRGRLRPEIGSGGWLWLWPSVFAEELVFRGLALPELEARRVVQVQLQIAKRSRSRLNAASSPLGPTSRGHS